MKKNFIAILLGTVLFPACSKHDNNAATGSGNTSLTAAYSKPKTIITAGYVNAIAGPAIDSIVYNITYDAQGRVLAVIRRAWYDLTFSADHDSISLQFSYDQNKTIRNYYTSSNPAYSSQDIYYKNPNGSFLDSTISLSLINNNWILEQKSVYKYNADGYANKKVQTAFDVAPGTAPQVSTTDYAWSGGNQLTMTTTNSQNPNAKTIYAYTYYDQQQLPFPTDSQESFAFTGLYYTRAIKSLSQQFTGTSQTNQDYNYTSFSVDKNNNLLSDTIALTAPSSPGWKSFSVEKFIY